MTIHSSQYGLSSSYNVNPEQVVTEWTEAVANLYENYRALSAYMHQIANRNLLQEKRHAYIGQCPEGQLVKLVANMQVALEKLFQDVSEGDDAKQLTTQQHCRQLADHTLCLNQLNNQAQSRLHLLSLSTS